MAHTVGSVIQRSLQLVVDPALRRRALLRMGRAVRKGTIHNLPELIKYDVLERPHYAYGMYQAAREAKSLKLPAFSVIEFGVAGAAGLLVMEQLAERIEADTGVKIQVYGFDTAAGMPPPKDHRDMPYVWTTGQFAPHEDFRPRLKRSVFVIGDVADTVPAFFANHRPAPIGFVAHDLDYYYSTAAGLGLFDGPHEFLLPRVFVYLDDIVGDDHELHSEFTGELLAVQEFNQRHASRKVAPIHLLRHKRPIPHQWNDQMYAAHFFDHPRYNEYTNPRWRKPAGQRPIDAAPAAKPA